jgi:lipocalin
MALDENRNTDRLPKWAAELIVGLKRERDHALKEQADSINAQTYSTVWYDVRTGAAYVRRYIQTDSVTFQVGDVEVSVQVIQRCGQPAPGLEINAGCEDLVVLPRAANMVTVRAEP